MKKDIKHKHSPKRKVASASLRFDAKDFPHHSKNQFWYLGIGILVVIGLYIALQNQDYLFGAVVITAGIALFRLSNLHPETKKIELTEKGVYWGNQFFSYHQLKSFWLAESGDHTNLYLDRLNMAPTISFVIPQKDAVTVMEFLSLFLPYHPHKREPVSDRFNRFFRL